MASSTTSSTTSSTASGTRSSRGGRLASRRHATPRHPCAGQTGKPVGLVARWAEVPRAVLRVVCAVDAGSTRAEPRRTVAEPLRPSPPPPVRSCPSRVGVSSAPRFVRRFPTRRAATIRNLVSTRYLCFLGHIRAKRTGSCLRGTSSPKKNRGLFEDLFNPRHRSSLTTIHHGRLCFVVQAAAG